MSRLKKEFAQRKFNRHMNWLSDHLACVDPEEFIQLAWATWGLQQPEPISAARGLIHHTAEAVTNDFTSRWTVHEWEWESLMNLMFGSKTGQRRVDCRDIRIALEFAGRLREAENQESGVYLASGTAIRDELHRIAHRQFPWQSGFVNRADFYRSLYLYGRGQRATYFQSSYGVSIEDFTKVGFALLGGLNERPWLNTGFELHELGIDRETVERVGLHMSVHVDDTCGQMKVLTEKLGASGQPIAYRPSLLRLFPIIRCGSKGQRLRAPLPPLIMLRMSAGLYYDLQGAGGGIRHEIATAFEAYCREFMLATLPALAIEPEYKYRHGRPRREIASPDLLISNNGELAFVIECKATKLTYAAQFADSPAKQAAEKYEEIAKGVFQIWRFFSHCRRGITRHQLTDLTRGVVLTLDSWLIVSIGLRDFVLARARAMCAADPDILAADQRAVLFSSIQDFERLALSTDETGVSQTLQDATGDIYTGWSLPDIRDKQGYRRAIEKPYPFDVADILPWWKDVHRQNRD